MKRIIGIICSAVVLCLILGIMCSAESGSVYFSDPTVTVGNTVSITVTVKGDGVDGYEMTLTYDTSYLQYVSSSGFTSMGGAADNGGSIKIIDMGAANGSLKCTLNFKTLKIGTTKITPFSYVFYNGGGDEIPGASIGDSTIQINPVPTASSDATLRSLAISPGVLSPEFSPSVTEYSATVTPEVSGIAVSAVKNHQAAKIYVTGADVLEVGVNTVSVKVVAEDGTTKNYNIYVTRNAATIVIPDPPADEKNMITLFDGNIVTVAEKIDDSIVPAGFTKSAMTLNGKTVDCLRYSESGLPMIYLLEDENTVEGLYFFDEEKLQANMLTTLSSSGNIILLDISGVVCPEGYEKGKYTIGNKEYDVFLPVNKKDAKYCLVYGMGSGGKAAVYVYDTEEFTFQRYGIIDSGKEIVIQTEKKTETREPVRTENDKTPILEKNNTLTYIIIGGIVIIAALIGVTIFIVKRYY